MARKELPMFVWFPPDRSQQGWELTINGVDVRNRVISGEFTYGILGEDLSCDIQLENSDGSLLNEFQENHIIIFKMDYSGGETKQWEGEIESIIDNFQQNYMLKIIGSHYSIRTADIIVNKEYTNSTISAIRTDLISTYMPGFTSNNVETSTVTIPIIKFVDKPFTDCMLDLNIQGKEDCFIDHTKDFHSFVKGSKNNDDEALVIYDNMFTLNGLGQINTDKRNKVTVYGESDGVPVIHVSSTTQTRTREKIVTESSSKDEDSAEELADAELDKNSNPETEGEMDCIFIPNLTPAYMTYIVSPDQDITARYRLSKWTYKIPDETMKVFVSQNRTIAKYFKDRILKDISQENIINPFSMTRSYILTFDNEDKISTSGSSGYIIEGGILRKDTAVETAIILTNVKVSDKTANDVHLKAVGDLLDGASFKFRALNSAVLQSVNYNSSSVTSVDDPGKSIQVEIRITNNNTRIDTLGFYWKE